MFYRCPVFANQTLGLHLPDGRSTPEVYQSLARKKRLSYYAHLRTNWWWCITYKTIYSGQSKKLQGPLWRSHTTMSAYDCRNKCVFSFQRNDNSDVAVVTSRGRVCQGPAVANERSREFIRIAPCFFSRQHPYWCRWSLLSDPEGIGGRVGLGQHDGECC